MTYKPAYSRNHPLEMEPVVSGQQLDPLMFALLSMGLPFGHEKEFEILMPKGAIIDKLHNYIYRVGKDTKTMFSCHLDTVHREPTEVFPYITGDLMVYGKSKPKEVLLPSVLGADDKTGAWLMLQMMHAKIPGLYVFHAGEERGGKGSQYIVKETPEIVKNIDRCIALDRKGYEDVITRQAGGVCCSDTFGKALADTLNINLTAKFNEYKTSTHGVFTDSANYRGLVPECTNLSVGYFEQHFKDEHFDWIWLDQILLPALLNMDWENLPTEREPILHQTGKTTSYAPSAQIIDFKDVQYSTPYNQMPAWNPGDPILDTVDDYKYGFLLQKFIVTKGIGQACNAIIKALKKKEEPQFTKAALDTLQEQINEKQQEIDLLKDELEIWEKLYQSQDNNIPTIINERDDYAKMLDKIGDLANEIYEIVYCDETEEEDQEEQDA